MAVYKKNSSRIMVVDRSGVARSIISRILKKEIKNTSIITCGSAEEAIDYLQQEKFDLITTSLLLSGLDGLSLCKEVRKSDIQRFTPVIIVSGDADIRLLREGFSAGVTDYFNKSLGYDRLVKFIKEISQRHSGIVGKVLYVEDSPSAAHTTRIMMEKHGLSITHVKSGEKALELLKNPEGDENTEFDIVFSDFFLEGEMTGGDLLYAIRTQLHYSRQEMPVLVVTIEDNEKCEIDIYHAGANDFITKPLIEEALIARLSSLLLIKHQYKLLKRYSKSIYKLQTTDSLSGVYNKKFLFEEGKKFVARYQNVCLMMVDIDNFEKFNDAQGHMIGDHILQMFGQFLINFFPKAVIVARFTGKKFAALVPDCGINKGKAIAEKLRHQVIKLKSEGLEITISIGLSSSEGVAKANLTTLVSDADTALRAAHKQGHNCTCLCVTNKNIVNA